MYSTELSESLEVVEELLEESELEVDVELLVESALPCAPRLPLAGLGFDSRSG